MSFSVDSLKNDFIKNFYNDNQDINFEDANILFIQIFRMFDDLKKNKTTELINEKIDLSFLKKGEDELEIILNKINPTANILKNENSEFFYDFLLSRENKQKIIIESKGENGNIKNNQIELFINSCKQMNSNGIFISQSSGITNKYNYQIDVFGTIIIVYIHYANYDIAKIKIAFDIVDNMYENITKNNAFSLFNEDNFISKDLLNEINQEYQCFVKQKDELKNFIKENDNKLLNQLEDVKMNHLNKYLSSKFINNQQNIKIHKCNLCNFYTSNTLKGMAAHKRGCKKKHSNIL